MSWFSHIDIALIGAGVAVGFLVGLTGMGGGALLTPLLVLVFGVPPVAAVSSDLVTSLVMKPVGAAVHLRRKTVETGLLRWLMVGSIPAAFLGAVAIGLLGRSETVQADVKLAIGAALLLAVAGTLFRQLVDRRQQGGTPAGLTVRPVRTAVIGAIGGFAVGMTSVGAGSLVISLLLIAYPQLRPSRLVGTDIVQAVPLVASAAIGHMIFGDVRLAVTGSLLIGALPAIYVGSRLSAQASPMFVRPVLSSVLVASSLALLHAPTLTMLCGAGVALVIVAAVQPVRRPELAATVVEPTVQA